MFYYKIKKQTETITGKVAENNLSEITRENNSGHISIKCTPIFKSHSAYLVNKFADEQISKAEWLEELEFVTFYIND
jgi:hypothetical protein